MSFDHEVSRFAVNALIGAETFKMLRHSVDASDGLSESEVYLALREALNLKNGGGMDDVSIAHFVREGGDRVRHATSSSYQFWY